MSIADRYPEHCDANGKPVLVGPNCETCGKLATVFYECQACPRVFPVHGAYAWSWQGKSHYHRPDDETDHTAIANHVLSHSPHTFAVARTDA